jgi:N-acylneuraminate cytidylyltransferase
VKDRPPVVAVILARGGSKGIKLKNLQQVAGQSLVYRAARACAGAETLDRVFVYSDHQQILYEAERGGATPVERPADAAGDRQTSEDGVRHFLTHHDMGGADVMLVQATSPFLRSGHVDEAVRLLHSRYDELDSVVSVFPVSFYLGFIGHEERSTARYWKPFYPSRWRRQDFEPDLYAETGALYLAKRSIWDSGRRMGEKTGIVVAGRWESIEVDESEDLEVARAIAPVVRKETGHAVQVNEAEAVSLREEASRGGQARSPLAEEDD